MTGSAKKMLFQGASELGSGADLNALSENGMYYWYSGNAPSNAPSDGNYLLVNLIHPRGAVQLAYKTYNGTAFLMRTKHYSNWDSWMTVSIS